MGEEKKCILLINTTKKNATIFLLDILKKLFSHYIIIII